MYEGDSFFTLGSAERAGLVVLSVMLALLTLYVIYRLAAAVPEIARPALGLAVFWAFSWLSPQAYYAYYLLTFEALPWQIVVGEPPDIVQLFRVLVFSGKQSLSSHFLGIFGWLCILAASIVPRRKNPGAARRGKSDM